MPTIYDIPLNVEVGNTSTVQSTVCGDNIWIADTRRDFHHRLYFHYVRLTVFNTVTFESRSEMCDDLNVRDLYIEEMTSHGDNIYMVLKIPREREGYYLYMFNTRSWEFEEVSTFHARLFGKLVVRGNTIYSLDYKSRGENKLYLFKMHLLGRVVIRRTVLDIELDPQLRHQLLKFGDQLYLFTSRNHWHQMDLINDNGERARCIPLGPHQWDPMFARFSNSVHPHLFDSPYFYKIAKYLEHGYFYDFTVQTVEQVGDRAYVTVIGSNGGRPSLEIRVISYNTSLEEICLAQLNDELFEESDSEVAKVVKQLPFGMRPKLLNMTGRSEDIIKPPRKKSFWDFIWKRF